MNHPSAREDKRRSTFQSGFHPSHGTETALVTLTDDLQRQINQGRLMLSLLLKLKAAFDAVNYNLLARLLTSTRICRSASGTPPLSMVEDRWWWSKGNWLNDTHPLECNFLPSALQHLHDHSCPECPEVWAGSSPVCWWHSALSVGWTDSAPDVEQVMADRAKTWISWSWIHQRWWSCTWVMGV